MGIESANLQYMTASRKLIDLFCGAGGLSLGAHLAGFTTELAVDVDSNLTSSFDENFPGAELLLADISRMSGKLLLEKAGLTNDKTFGLIGGPPCQGFSLMGNRDENDPRNTLIGHFFRLIQETKPAFFVMENVPGILIGKPRLLLESAMSDLKGYNMLGPIRVEASDFGAATKRERIVVIGLRDGQITQQQVDQQRVKEKATVRCAISDLPEPVTDGWASYRNVAAISPYAERAREFHEPLGAVLLKEQMKQGRISGVQPTEHTRIVRRRFSRVPVGKTDSISRCPRLDWDFLAPTLRAGTGPEHGSFQSIRPIHPTSDRVITVREGARLQGFPDWFKFHDTKWHSFRMIGNSVSPFMSEALLKAIASAI
jgi:DNA (cytosine-5)-methyltransferase 1